MPLLSSKFHETTAPRMKLEIGGDEAPLPQVHSTLFSIPSGPTASPDGTLSGMIVDLPKVRPPQMPRRFGLRVMFIAMTLMAVVLGLVVSRSS